MHNVFVVALCDIVHYIEIKNFRERNPEKHAHRSKKSNETNTVMMTTFYNWI